MSPGSGAPGPEELDGLPFYRQRVMQDGRTAPWTIDDLLAAAPGDPFAGRVAAHTTPRLRLQLEASEDSSVWVGAEPDELRAWSTPLEGMFRRWGLRRGELIAFFEYGSSPVVLLSSRSYCPYLGSGAGDRVGLDMVCNDGSASFAGRMSELVRLLRPAAVVLRADVVAPLVAALALRGQDLAESVRWAAVSEVEGAVRRADADRWQQELGVPVRRIARADAAFFLAGDCPECGLFHVDSGSYLLEELPGAETVVTTVFAKSCPSVRYALWRASIHPPGCPTEPAAARLEWS